MSIWIDDEGKRLYMPDIPMHTVWDCYLADKFNHARNRRNYHLSPIECIPRNEEIRLEQ